MISNSESRKSSQKLRTRGRLAFLLKKMVETIIWLSKQLPINFLIYWTNSFSYFCCVCVLSWHKSILKLKWTLKLNWFSFSILFSLCAKTERSSVFSNCFQGLKGQFIWITEILACIFSVAANIAFTITAKISFILCVRAYVQFHLVYMWFLFEVNCFSGLMIRAAALPVASCHGSALISAGMKVTGDDRQPNAFSPAADFLTQTPRFRQMGAGRQQLQHGRPSACACDVALWWSCQTLHAWPCLPLSHSHGFHFCC